MLCIAGTAPWGLSLLWASRPCSQKLVILHTDSTRPDEGEVHISSTVSGAFNGQPDQIHAIVGHGDLVYFCEDGGDDCGVHARDGSGNFYTILDAFPYYPSETTGLALSPGVPSSTRISSQVPVMDLTEVLVPT